VDELDVLQINMKRHFGSFLARSPFGASTTLTDLEHRVIEELVRRLPDFLRKIVEEQFESYTQVEREIDGRAFNFWRTRFGRGVDMRGVASLEMSVDEATMIRVTFDMSDDAKPLHATLNAIKGRVFCVAISRRIDKCPPSTTFVVIKIKEAWRSNFHNQNNEEGEQAGTCDAEEAV
jgi:hypothetical protein